MKCLLSGSVLPGHQMSVVGSNLLLLFVILTLRSRELHPQLPLNGDCKQARPLPTIKPLVCVPPHCGRAPPFPGLLSNCLSNAQWTEDLEFLSKGKK